LIAQLVLHFADPGLAPKGFTTLIVGMLFIGGIQLLCLAIIGSYVAHIYEESKHRPPYLVESILNDPGRVTGENDTPGRTSEERSASERTTRASGTAAGERGSPRRERERITQP
jgi:hypothetical protein